MSFRCRLPLGRLFSLLALWYNPCSPSLQSIRWWHSRGIVVLFRFWFADSSRRIGRDLVVPIGPNRGEVNWDRLIQRERSIAIFDSFALARGTGDASGVDGGRDLLTRQRRTGTNPMGKGNRQATSFHTCRACGTNRTLPALLRLASVRFVNENAVKGAHRCCSAKKKEKSNVRCRRAADPPPPSIPHANWPPAQTPGLLFPF